jgi:hypothetical protein
MLIWDTMALLKKVNAAKNLSEYRGVLGLSGSRA